MKKLDIARAALELVLDSVSVTDQKQLDDALSAKTTALSLAGPDYMLFKQWHGQFSQFRAGLGALANQDANAAKAAAAAVPAPK